MTSAIFLMYILRVRRDYKYDKILSKAISEIKFEKAPSLNLEKKLFGGLSNNFEERLKLAISSIKESKFKLDELSRINKCKTDTLDTLLELSHFIISHNNENGIYETILKSAISVVEKATKGSILILNPDTQRYEYQSAVGFNMEYLSKVSFKLEETFLYQNAHGDLSMPMVISNVTTFDTSMLSHETIEWLSKASGLDIKEALSTPIIIDDKIYAILNLDSPYEHAFDEVDIQLIQFFSTQIAISIKNKMLVDETIKLSKFDNLTGAYNRNYFEKLFENHNELTIENLEPYVIILCDLNFLKVINDNFGHTAGDMILTEFASIIKQSISETDIFSRVGGDEFVVLLKNISTEKAFEKIEDIFEKYEYHTINYNGHKLPVSFSYGIASSPDDSMIYEVLAKIADHRMYEFKREYKQTHQNLLKSITT